MLRKFLLIFLVFSFYEITIAQEGVTPAVRAIQNELIKNFEDTGYGDYEIDLLHKKIGILIPKMQNKFEKDENGESILKLEVTAGESRRTTGEHYIINGYAYLYPGENGDLKKIVLRYYRQNAGGNTYIREKRELVNPTPFFFGSDKVDSSDDISLSLSEAHKADDNEKLVREILFKNIDRHDRKIKLLESYKQYLRKTLNALEKHIRRIELDNASELLFMLEFE